MLQRESYNSFASSDSCSLHQRTEPVQDIHVFTCFFNTRETHDAMNRGRALSHLPPLCIFNKSHVLVASPQTYLVSLQPHSTKKEQEALREEPSGSATSVSPKLASLSLLFSCSLFSGLGPDLLLFLFTSLTLH